MMSSLPGCKSGPALYPVYPIGEVSIAGDWSPQLKAWFCIYVTFQAELTGDQTSNRIRSVLIEGSVEKTFSIGNAVIGINRRGSRAGPISHLSTFLGCPDSAMP